MTPEEIQEIKRVCNTLLTPAPWEWGTEISTGEYYELKPQVISAMGQSSDSFWIRNLYDRDFIVNARSLVPELIAEIEHLQPFQSVALQAQNAAIELSKELAIYKRALELATRGRSVTWMEWCLKEARTEIEGEEKKEEIPYIAIDNPPLGHDFVGGF